MRLIVRVDKKAADLALQGFPWGEEQWITAEVERDNTLEVVIRLGEAGDTNVAQEYFLNTSPAVLCWDVVSE